MVGPCRRAAMSEEDRERLDRNHTGQGQSTQPVPPWLEDIWAELLAPRLAEGARAMDLAPGRGRISVWLAERGLAHSPTGGAPPCSLWPSDRSVPMPACAGAAFGVCFTTRKRSGRLAWRNTFQRMLLPRARWVKPGVKVSRRPQGWFVASSRS